MLTLVVDDLRVWCFDQNGYSVGLLPISESPAIGVDGGFRAGAIVTFAKNGLPAGIRVQDPSSTFETSTIYFENGRIRIYSEWEDQELNGYFRGWFENGTLRIEGRNFDGQKDGTWRFWNDDGTLRTTVVYERGAELNRTP